MSTRDPEIERGLSQLRDEASPSVGDKQRIRAKVAAVLDISPPAAPPEQPRGQERTALSSGPVASLARRVGRWLGAGVCFGLIGLTAGFWLGRRAEPAAGERPVAADTTRAERTVAVTPVAASSNRQAAVIPNVEADIEAADAVATTAARRAPAPPAAVVPVPHKKRPVGPRADEKRRAPFTLGEGLELLAQAERALHADDPALSLAVLGDLDRRAPQDMLRQERLMTQALACCAMRDTPGAVAVRQQLQREFPNSIYARRLERACADDASPVSVDPSQVDSNRMPANLDRSGH
jgi:hypothetical protein